jgi:hypothetical protein
MTSMWPCSSLFGMKAHHSPSEIVFIKRRWSPPLLSSSTHRDHLTGKACRRRTQIHESSSFCCSLVLERSISCFATQFGSEEYSQRSLGEYYQVCSESNHRLSCQITLTLCLSLCLSLSCSLSRSLSLSLSVSLSVSLSLALSLVLYLSLSPCSCSPV